MSTSRPTRRRNAGWVVLLACAVALLAVAVIDRNDGPADNNERVFALSQQFACPVCGGQSIAESEVPIAREIRKEIRTRLDQGQTDEQIRQYLVGLYGEDIALLPKASGVTGLVWFLPVFAFVLAIAGLVAVFRRWRAEVPSVATDADRALVEEALARGAEAHDV
jgi:cytochrome c-type biogenesis protein CcmH